MATDRSTLGKFFRDAHSAETEAFVRSYTPVLIRFFLRKGAQIATAEDLVNDVFTRLLHRDSVGTIDNPKAYLMRAAANVWSDHMRRRQVRHHGGHVAYEDRLHALEDFAPDRVFEGREGVKHLIEALRELPPRTQEVFARCKIEGEKHKAVAARLGISVSAVEKHLVRALAHLGSKMREDGA